VIADRIPTRPTLNLVRDHQLILRMLEVFERFLDQGDEVGRIDGADGVEILDFLRTFGDRCHHTKEEDLLFPRLRAKGWPDEQGPAALATMDHHQERALLRELALQLDPAAHGDAEALAAFSARARSYVALLRDHIAREDREVFPLAERLLDEQSKETLARALDEVETVHHPATHQRMVEIERRMCAKYAVSEEPGDEGRLAPGLAGPGP
jgi:hemerythrin-like domain-containing protein